MKKIERIGEIHKTKQGYEIEIIDYRGAFEVDIKFKDGIILKNREYQEVVKGSIKNPYHPTFCGVGYLGEGKYKTSINNKNTRNSNLWGHAIKRCYSKNRTHRNLSYISCSVDSHWHNFQNFAEWYEENWKPCMQNWELDKDILIKGNKIYSSETCELVPSEINRLFMVSNKNRGQYPIGVRKVKNKFTTSIKGKHIGTFNTSEEAFQAYKIAKEAWIKEVANKWRDKITERCYFAMINYKVEITD